MRKSTGRSSTNDVVELRVPLKSEYLPILRAITGVVAGVIFFNYDEIMQLRVAVSEVFDLGIKRPSHMSAVGELDVRFSIHPDKVEILMVGPKGYASHLNQEQGKESLALLQSLMDEIEFGAEVAGKTLVRIVKYKPLKSGT